MSMAPRTTKYTRDIGHSMAHSYNTRLRKSRDGNLEGELLPDSGEITGFFQHLDVECENKSGNKKSEKNQKLNQAAMLIWS